MQNACMKNIQIRNVPEKTHAVLRRRTAAAGMSLQEYLLGMINAVTARPTVEELMRGIKRRGGVDISVDEIVEGIREDRDSR